MPAQTGSSFFKNATLLYRRGAEKKKTADEGIYHINVI